MLDSRHRNQTAEPLGESRRLADEIKRLIVDTAKLRDVHAEHIDERAPLFESLGLDSLDALQIAAALRKQYGVFLDAGRDLAAAAASVTSIVALVLAERRSR
jgi:acyl carrier protein